jgi:hypothetical protein
VAGNELADREARRAAQGADPSALLDTWCNGRLLERRFLRWYQDRAGRQERNLVGEVLDPTEDAVIRSDLRWTRDLPSRFAAVLVGQFLTGHYPTRVYLARFHLVDSALCTACGCPDTRAHLLLDCIRFSYAREYLTSWLREVFSLRTRRPGRTCLGWDWDFLTASSEGRLWLSRFLRATRRGRGRWDDLEATMRQEQEGSAAARGAGADAGADIMDSEVTEEDDLEDMEED